MKITSIKCIHETEGTRITIATEAYADIYFAYDRKIVENNIGELALLVLLGQSMILGSALVIPAQYPICPRLLRSLDDYQDIFCAWYPHMKKIEVHCTPKTAADYAEPQLLGISLFSGGVDSIYTFFRKRDEIDTVLLCKGLDLKLSETQRIQETVTQCTEFARRFDTSLVTVETNVKDVIVPYATECLHGMLLVGMSLALCPQKLFVPASHTYTELERWGSHPLTDPLLSTDRTQVVHHGAKRRSLKLAYLAGDQQLLDILRVCNASDEYNCCKCEKCIRTMFALKVLDKTSKALKELSIQDLKQVRLYNESAATFWRDNMLLAREKGNTRLHDIASSMVKRYEGKRMIKRLLGMGS